MPPTDPVYSAAELAAAGECCTELQMEVLRLRNKGIGVNSIGRTLGISPSAVRGRLDAANLRVRRAIEEGRTAA